MCNSTWQYIPNVTYGNNMRNLNTSQYGNNFQGPNVVNNGDRFIGGGFLGPFILGGITGGLLAPSFGPRPMYPAPMPVPYQTYQSFQSFPIQYQ